MSVGSNLFFSTNTEAQTLHRRIVPSDTQRENQQERWNDLRDYLIEDLSEKTGYPVTSWLQGSYKFGTQIRPAKISEEFDIDLGIYFNWSGEPNEGNFSPLELKNMVQESIIAYAQETGDEVLRVADPKKRCARIHFAGNFHIDVPVYHIDHERDIRHLATEDNTWENSDPKALYSWFREECGDEESSRQIRRLIRYFKMWAAQKFSEDQRPSTILLTVLMVQAFGQVSSDITDDDDLFEACINEIINSLNQSSIISNPVDYQENLNRMSDDDFENFVNELANLSEVAQRGTSATTSADAGVIWQEAFHHFFPLPEELKDENNISNALMVVQFIPEISVRAQPKDNPSFKTYTGVNKIGPIPKGCNIVFKLQNEARLPYGAVVEWMVRNEGNEAEYINDLGHFSNSGGEIKEHSAYNGTHYMDVVVKQFGSPIGFRRIPVEISGPAIPPRNPKRKPGYFKIKNRRR